MVSENRTKRILYSCIRFFLWMKYYWKFSFKTWKTFQNYWFTQLVAKWLCSFMRTRCVCIWLLDYTQTLIFYIKWKNLQYQESGRVTCRQWVVLSGCDVALVLSCCRNCTTTVAWVDTRLNSCRTPSTFYQHSDSSSSWDPCIVCAVEQHRCSPTVATQRLPYHYLCCFRHRSRYFPHWWRL